MRILLCVSGASGAALPLDFLKRSGIEEQYVVVSEWGRAMLKEELGVGEDALHALAKKGYANGDLNAPFSSGATPLDATVILPCSADIVGKIASGIADTLILRAAHVALKERRRLIVCLRETPMSDILLENCLKLSRAGAVVMPVMPAFYSKPQSIDEMVANFNDRVFALVGCGQAKPWREEAL